MKIAACLVIAANAVKIDRSVPPRHPTNRLARLQNFCETLTQAEYLKSERFENVKRRCAGWANARHQAFDKCGFYSADIKHGGPDPNVEFVEPANSLWGEGRIDLYADRKRRSTDDECADWDGNMNGIKYFMWTDEYEGETVRVQKDNVCAPDFIHKDWLSADYVQKMLEIQYMDCVSECVEDESEAKCEAECVAESSTLRGKKNGGNGNRINRINNMGPFRAAKSIVTGMRKWGERYLAECAGRRTGRHMMRRHRFMKTCARKFVPGLCTHEQCTEADFGPGFNWGRKNVLLSSPYQ